MWLYILRRLSPKTALSDHWLPLDPRIPWQFTLCKESPIVSDSVYLIDSPSISVSVIVCVYVYVWHDWATFTSLHFTGQWCYPPWSQSIKDCPGVTNPCLSSPQVQRPGCVCLCVCVPAQINYPIISMSPMPPTILGILRTSFVPDPTQGRILAGNTKVGAKQSCLK